MAFEPSTPKEGEPSFTLMARDPEAPHLLRAWAYRRCGQHALAQQEAAKAEALTMRSEPQQSGDPQIISAFRIADEMERYFRDQIVNGGGSK